MFDYLQMHDGPVVEGLEQNETVFAKDQPQYRPLRTLPGENGNSAISRFSLTEEQRKAVQEGADIYLEILHFKGPLAPSRLMLMTEPKENNRNFKEWWKVQTKGNYSIFKPHQERVVIEKQELDEKLDKLGAFLEGDIYRNLPQDEQKRLARQFHSMTDYSTVLAERIAAF